MTTDDRLRLAQGQARVARQYLRQLTQAVSVACAKLDAVLQEPASKTRDRGIDVIITALDLANDRALTFGLDKSFQAIAREKKRLATWAKES